jgi:hypothetical protein
MSPVGTSIKTLFSANEKTESLYDERGPQMKHYCKKELCHGGISAVLLALLLFSLLTGQVLAQSTDRNNPSPWPAGGASGSGPDRDTSYYYWLDAGPGSLEISAWGRPREFSTGVTLVVFDAANNDLGQVGMITSARSDPAVINRVSVPTMQRLLLELRLTGNNAEYRVTINQTAGPTPTPTPTPTTTSSASDMQNQIAPVHAIMPWPGQIKELGNGRSYEAYYSLDAGPGDLLLTVAIMARTGTSTIRVRVYEHGFTGPVRTDMTVTGTTAREENRQERISLSERRTLNISVIVDANAYDYVVDIGGAVNR